MKHTFTITIDTPDLLVAERVRDRAVGAIDDFTESSRPGFSIDCGRLEEVNDQDEIDRLYIAKAQEQFALGSSDDIEIDDDAMVDPIEGGAWVYGRAFVRDDEEIEAAHEAAEQKLREPGGDDSEGGHCD